MKLKKFNPGWLLFLFGMMTSTCLAEISPLSLTFFGMYGSPVYPPALAIPASDGFGFNFLAEWNATSYTSLGLGFEQIAFRNSVTVPMLNFEGRLFPLENEKGPFSPYLYGGAGLNLSSGAWEGPVQLKAGIGSRVSLAGPLHFDVAVGSHWLQPPNDFQYVDIRYGLSMSFGFKEQPQSGQPAQAAATSKNSATSTPTAVLSPAATPTVNWTPIATLVISETKAEPSTIEMAAEPQTITINSAPVTTLAQAKQYYREGMNAFLGDENNPPNYPRALALLKKSLWVREHHKAPYFYAETYATLGVIYQVHSTEKNHKQTALKYYQKALKIDPTTKSAKHYYSKLKAELAKSKPKTKKKSKPKSKPKPVSSTSSDLSVDLGNTATPNP